MQAINTKFFGPSNSKLDRIKATASGGKSVTVSYDYALSSNQNHDMAAQALRDRLEWTGRMVSGDTKDGKVYVFEPKATEALREALGNLCQHVAGNRGNRSGNPYCVPEMRGALKALHEDHTGMPADEYSVYCDAADKYRKEG